MYGPARMDLLLITPSLDEGIPEGRDALRTAKVMRALGHTVQVVSPLLAGMDTSSFARRLTSLAPEVHGQARPCFLLEGRTTAGAQLALIGNAELFGALRSFGAGTLDEERTAAEVFARAVRTWLDATDRPFHATHAFGWAGALALGSIADHPLLLTGPRLLSWEANEGDARALGQTLAHGVGCAAHVFVPSSAAEARVRALLAAHGERPPQVHVRARVVDTAEWNPATSRHLPRATGRTEAETRSEHKRALATRAGLSPRAEVPVLGVWFAPEDSARVHQVLAALPEALRNDVQIVWLTDGAAPGVDAKLKDLAQRWPDRFAVLGEASRELAETLLGGADFLLTTAEGSDSPPRELLALRYGAPPVLPRPASPAGHVVDFDPELLTGTAILMEDDSEAGWLRGIRRAAAAFKRSAALTERRAFIASLERSAEGEAKRLEALYQPAPTAAPTAPEVTA